MIRILLVDDQRMIRETLRTWLEPEADFQIIGTADNGISAIDQVEKLQPDIVLMNMEMPGLDGVSATRFIATKFINTKVLILSAFDRDDYIAKSLSVGAKGYLLKNTNSQDVATAIRSVHKGYTQIAPGLIEKLLIYTDSGTIINKLNQSEDAKQSNILSREKQFIAKTKGAILRLQSTVKQQGLDLVTVQDNLKQITEESNQTKKTLSQHSKIHLLTWLFLLSLIPFFTFFLNNLYGKAQKLAQNSFPIERVGIYQEYDLSGLAQRVAKTFKQDALLTDVSTIYVAQKDSTIILKGRIADLTLLERMKELAGSVKGVTEVNTDQVTVLTP